MQKRDADAARQAAINEKQEADAARQAALLEQQQLAAGTERANTAAAEADRLRQKAEQDQAQLRQQLLDQFNAILQTRDTARGLIVNMSDVLFDTAKYTLRPGAREKLAKVSGIILGHPGLEFKWKDTPIASAETNTTCGYRKIAPMPSGVTDRTRDSTSQRYCAGIREDAAGGGQRDCGRPPNESPRGTGGFRRSYRDQHYGHTHVWSEQVAGPFHRSMIEPLKALNRARERLALLVQLFCPLCLFAFPPEASKTADPALQRESCPARLSQMVSLPA